MRQKVKSIKEGLIKLLKESMKLLVIIIISNKLLNIGNITEVVEILNETWTNIPENEK